MELLANLLNTEKHFAFLSNDFEQCDLQQISMKKKWTIWKKTSIPVNNVENQINRSWKMWSFFPFECSLNHLVVFCERERWVYLAHSGFLVLFLQGKFHFGRIINHCYFLRFDEPLLRSVPLEKRKKLSHYPTHQAWSIPHMNLFVCFFFPKRILAIREHS